jgi:hypothetical protein
LDWRGLLDLAEWIPGKGTNLTIFGPSMEEGGNQARFPAREDARVRWHREEADVASDSRDIWKT